MISLAADGTVKCLARPVVQRIFADMLQVSPKRFGPLPHCFPSVSRLDEWLPQRHKVRNWFCKVP